MHNDRAERADSIMLPRARLSEDRLDLAFSPEEIAALRERFARHRCLVLPRFLSPSLLARLRGISDSARFEREDVGKVGQRLIEPSGRAGAGLSLLMGNRAFLDLLESVTMAAPLARVTGAVARHGLQERSALDWHDDMSAPDRKLGITIDLGSPSYQGGAFELRRKRQASLLVRFTHDMPGSALVFLVGPDFEHRLTPVTSGGPRTVFAGWALAPAA
jgi:hypothetical protein